MSESRPRPNEPRSNAKPTLMFSGGAAGRAISAAVRSNRAQRRANDLMPVVTFIRQLGTTSFAGIARELNARQIPSPNGRVWYPTSVKTLLELVG